VKFIEASTEAGKSLGIKWDMLKEYGIEAYGPGTDLSRTRMGRDYLRTETLSSSGYSRSLVESPTGSAGSDLTAGAERIITKWATLSPDNARLALSALAEDKDAKLVANPRISTVDHKEASIKVAKQWPIPQWTFNSDTGTWEVQGFDYKDIGIILKVTPHINQDNFITLDVDPEVSDSKDTVTFGGGGGGTAQIPIVDTRTASTRVIVTSGETLVIGGLVRTDEVTTKSGVPVLKDIPLLGNIFRHTSKQKISLDLLIFITPTVVEGAAASILAPPAETPEQPAAETKPEAGAPAKES
jgi:type II secretory pathway component GspD/PulD (secretin)